MNLPPHTHKNVEYAKPGQKSESIYTWTTPAGIWKLNIIGDRYAEIDGPHTRIKRSYPDGLNETELTALLATVGAIEPEIVDAQIEDGRWDTYEPKLIARIHEHLDDNRAQWFGPGDRASTRDIAETMTHFVRDNFDFDGLEHDDWQPPVEDPLTVDEFFVAHGYRAVDGNWYANPVRVRRRPHHTGAWLSTTRSNTGAHMTVVEVQRTIFALARAANINVRVDGALYPTGTDPELAVRRGGIVAAALAAGQDPGWAAPQTDELKAAEDGRVAYISVSLTVEQDMIATSVRCPEPERHHIRHGWKASVDSEEIYVCPGDPRPERP